MERYSLSTVISRDPRRISVSLDSRSICTMDEGSVADPPIRKTRPFFAARLPQIIWLIDGFFQSTCPLLGFSQRTVGLDTGNPEFCSVPGHIGMIPGEPGQLGPVGAQAWC